MNKKLLLTLTALPLLLGSCVSKTSTGEKITTTKETTDWININYFRGNVESNLKKYRKINSEIYELVYEYDCEPKDFEDGNAYNALVDNKSTYIRLHYKNYSCTLTWTRYFKEIGMDGYFLNAAPTYYYDNGSAKEGATFGSIYKKYLIFNTSIVNNQDNFDSHCSNINNYSYISSESYSKYYTTDITSACYTFKRNIENVYFTINGSNTVVIKTSDKAKLGYEESYSGFSINTYLGK